MSQETARQASGAYGSAPWFQRALRWSFVDPRRASARQTSVYSNAVTLEHELFAAGNEALLREVFVELHPGSGQRWDADVAAMPANDRPGAFVHLLLSAMEVRKGDFAQTLAEHIVAGQAFAVPVYIRDAILKVSEA